MWFGQLVEYSHPLSKRKKQNNSSLFAPNVKVRPLQQNWKPTGCHRAQTFERHKVHVSRRGIYKKQKHIETQVRAIKRVNRDHIQSTCFTHFFFIVFLSVFIKDFVRGRNIQRDTFANLNKHTVQYIQSELDTHSFHAIQWKHLKPGWPSPWSFPFLLPLLCSPPIYRHSTLFEATNAPGRFLTGGVRALMTLHAKLFLSSSFFIFYFFKCPTLGERTAQWRQWCWTAELLFFFLLITS